MSFKDGVVTLIRRAHREDAPQIAAVHVETWRTAYPDLLPESVMAAFSVEAGRTAWEQRLSGGSTETFVSLVEDAVVGWTTVGSPRDTDLGSLSAEELYGLYVLPRFWARGLGYGLYQAAEQRMRQRGGQIAVLWVLEENRRARRFYERQGYLLEPGRVKALEYQGAQAWAVRYRKALRTD